MSCLCWAFKQNKGKYKKKKEKCHHYLKELMRCIMGHDSVKGHHRVLWRKYSGTEAKEEIYSRALISCIHSNFFSDILLCITHWLLLTCPSFDLLHRGNYQTALGFITSQVPLGSRARGEKAVPCGRCQKTAHLFLEILWPKYYTDFISPPKYWDSLLSK